MTPNSPEQKLIELADWIGSLDCWNASNKSAAQHEEYSKIIRAVAFELAELREKADETKRAAVWIPVETYERDLALVTQERDALRTAWLEIRQRELRSHGMKVEQARIHAEAELHSGTVAIRALKTEGR